MKIQVFGPNGCLGQAVCKAIEARGHMCIRDAQEILDSAILDSDVPVTINCAGVIKQRLADYLDRTYTHRWLMQSNALAPHWIAGLLDENQRQQRLIHVSTDCVFWQPGPHSESDQPTPNDIYSISKLAGEVTHSPHLTIRTSFIGFGKRGLLADVQAGMPMKASRNLLWSGHTVATIADLLVTLAERPDVTGLLHVPGEFQSRADLVNRLGHALCLPLDSVSFDDSFVADRRLVSQRWELRGLPVLPAFSEQLERLAADYGGSPDQQCLIAGGCTHE